jgi:O-antigen/teichoic acid export membrane protein
MSSIFEKLKKYKVAKNTSVLALGQILSRFLTIFYLAALARYVGTEGIGQISTANALNNILLLLVVPGLSILFVRDVAPEPEKASNYISNMIFLRLIFIIPYVAFSVGFAYLGGYPQETAYIIHLYMALYMFDTLSEVLISAFRANERMEYEAGIQLARDLINIGVSLVAIYLEWSLIAIVAVSVFAQFCKFSMSLWAVWGRFARPKLSVDLSLTKSLLFASLPFGLLLVISTLQSQLGTFVLSLFHAADTVGIYAAANTLIVMLLFIPNSFAGAIFPNFSRLHHESQDNLRHFYQLSYKYLLILGFPLGLGTMLVGDRAITLIYGGSFQEADDVIRIMAIFLFMIVGYSNGSLLHATNRQRFYAWTQGAAAILNGVLCFLLIPGFGPIGAAIAFTGSGVLTFFLHSIACHRQLDLNLPWLTMGQVAVATLVMGLAVVAGIEIGIPWFIVAALIAPIVYLGALLGLRIVQLQELKTLAGGQMPSPKAVENPA